MNCVFFLARPMIQISTSINTYIYPEQLSGLAHVHASTVGAADAAI